MEKITSREQLNKLIEDANGDYIDTFILLNGGCRSSKEITFGEEENTYSIFNEIDGSDDTISFSDFDNSFIGEAMSKGAFFKY